MSKTCEIPLSRQGVNNFKKMDYSKALITVIFRLVNNGVTVILYILQKSNE